METEKIDKLIEFLQDVLRVPKMHFGKDDDPEIAHSFLVGIRYATFHIFDLDRYSIPNIMSEIIAKRKHRFTSRGAIQDLVDEGYESKLIVTELIEIEIDFWKFVRDKK